MAGEIIHNEPSPFNALLVVVALKAMDGMRRDSTTKFKSETTS